MPYGPPHPPTQSGVLMLDTSTAAPQGRTHARTHARLHTPTPTASPSATGDHSSGSSRRSHCARSGPQLWAGPRRGRSHLGRGLAAVAVESVELLVGLMVEFSAVSGCASPSGSHRGRQQKVLPTGHSAPETHIPACCWPLWDKALVLVFTPELWPWSAEGLSWKHAALALGLILGGDPLWPVTPIPPTGQTPCTQALTSKSRSEYRNFHFR